MRVPSLALAALLAAACTATPISTPTPTRTPAPTPTLEPILDFPAQSGIALEPGRYSSQPPFDREFSFAIPAPGWGSGHLNREFFDVITPAGLGVTPERWVAFALPETLHGAEHVPAAGLTPAEAVDVISTREEWTVSETENYTIDGVEGTQVDISVDAAGTTLFGVGTDTLQLDPAFDVRLIAVPHADSLTLVLVMAADGELEAGWTDSQPIVDSIRW